MAATPISDILTQVRQVLVETTADFWSDAELTSIFKLGVIDLWGAILDLHQDHYFAVVEDGSVQQPANASMLIGIPDDCFRVMLIEPLVVSSETTGVRYIPKKYKSDEFAAARARGTCDTAAGAGEILFDVTGPGAPVAAPRVLVAPKIATALPLRFAYYPMLTVNDSNPVPGGSDNALKAWTIAYANAKENAQGERVPDAGWLAVYATEKQSTLTRLTPRQEQEPDVAEGVFDGLM